MATLNYHMRSKLLFDTAKVLVYLLFISMVFSPCSGQVNQKTTCVQVEDSKYESISNNLTSYTECQVKCESHCICSLNSVSTITSNCSVENVSIVLKFGIQLMK